MPLSVAEYLGQRTDNKINHIIPSDFGGNITPACPFSGVACRKLNSQKPAQPVCSLRTQDGRPFIVCPDRLIPSKANALSPSHIASLAAVAQVQTTLAAGGKSQYWVFQRQNLQAQKQYFSTKYLRQFS